MGERGRDGRWVGGWVGEEYADVWLPSSCVTLCPVPFRDVFVSAIVIVIDTMSVVWLSVFVCACV